VQEFNGLVSKGSAAMLALLLCGNRVFSLHFQPWVFINLGSIDASCQPTTIFQARDIFRSNFSS
jgi:hypothetical protein